MGGEWRSLCLAELCELRAGAVFKPALQGQASGRYPFVKVSDMNLPENAVRMHVANNWVSEGDLRQLRAKPFPPGTVVFAKIGEALRQNRLRQLVRETLIDNNMMGAIPRTSVVDPRFFYYALSQFDFFDIAQGTALPYLTVSSLSALSIRCPPLSEQHAIAHILGTLDDKIELNRKMNRTLEAMARALFKSWFIDFDPVRAKAEGRQPAGMDAETAALFPDGFEDSELGPIPRGWSVGCIADIATNPRRTVQPEEIDPNTPYLALEHMPRRSIALPEWGRASGIASGKYQFNQGEILFGKLRPYFHKVGVPAISGICSTDILVIAPKSRCWFGFLLMHLSSSELIAHVTACSTGTRMPRTNWGDIGGFNVVLPPEKLSSLFTEKMSPILDRIHANIHESRTLAVLRNTLLPKLLSGKIQIKDGEHRGGWVSR